MGQTAGEIRQDIEQTRARMGATIDAIGYRLDVPARVRYRVSHMMHDTTLSPWRRLEAAVKDNALALGLGAVVVGVVAGMLIRRGR